MRKLVQMELNTYISSGPVSHTSSMATTPAPVLFDTIDISRPFLGARLDI